MKNLILFILASMTISLVNAQIQERESDISLGHQNAFVITHEGATKKITEKVIGDAIKEFGKVKRNKKAKEWSCLQCKVPGLSGTTNIYYTIEEQKGQTLTKIFFDDGTQFLSSDNDADAASTIKKRLTNVGFDVTRAVINEELKEEEKNLKKRNKEQEKLEKKNADLHKDIENYKKKIAEAEKAIEQNLQDQEDKKMEIEKQIRVVEDVTDRLNKVGNR